MRNRISGPMAEIEKNSGSGAKPRKFNALTLHRIASSYGLDREQTKLLDYVFRNDDVTDPERVMKSPDLLDKHFKRTIRTIKKNSGSEEETQEHLYKFFSLRNAIESSSANIDLSSFHISDKTPAILAYGKNSYPVKVISSKDRNVVVESPRNALGTPIRIAKGTEVSVSFFLNPSKGFYYAGHAGEAVDTDQGEGLQISHSGVMKPLANRRFRRISTDMDCEFFFVKIEQTGTGGKKTSKLVVGSTEHNGTIQDISTGGCSLKTSAPVQVGARLKIDIDYDEDHKMNVLGQIIRINRSAAGTIIHIKFLKVPRRAFNFISALVFGYNDD